MSKQIQAILEQLESKPGQVIVFHNSQPNSRYALKSGKECLFMGGEYATDVVAEAQELLEEIEAGNPHIHINTNKLIILKTDLDPMEALKAKIIKDYLEQMTTTQAGGADYGSSEQGKLNATSSVDVNAAASGSISGATTAPSTGTSKISVGPRG